MSGKKILVILVIVAVLVVGLVVAIFAGVFGMVFVGSKSVYEYKCSMTQLKSNDTAKQLLGEPIEESFYIVPSIKIENSRRFVDFSTGVSGPKGDGTLIVNSVRDSFRSDFQMTLEINGEKKSLYRGKYPCQDS